MSIIFLLPTAMPVAADTMNYACVFLVFILGIAYLYWFVQGHKFYTGPLTETTTEMEGVESSTPDASSRDGGVSNEKGTYTDV